MNTAIFINELAAWAAGFRAVDQLDYYLYSVKPRIHQGEMQGYTVTLTDGGGVDHNMTDAMAEKIKAMTVPFDDPCDDWTRNLHLLRKKS